MSALRKELSPIFTAAAAAALTLAAAGPANSAVRGLPFTEDFTDTNLRDEANTTANWGGGSLTLGTASTLTDLALAASTLGTGTEFDPASTASRDIAAGDIDGDGDLDLVACNSRQALLVYFNDGGFASPGAPLANAGNTRGVDLGDADNDGDLDILAANFNSPVKLYLNNGNGTFGDPIDVDISGSGTPFEASTWRAKFFDLDLDGDLDIATANNAQNNRVLINLLAETGALGFARADRLSGSRSSRDLDIGDVTGDGYPDIVYGEANGINSLYVNDQTGKFGAPVDIGTEANLTFAVVLSDLDADGDLDLVEGNQGQTTQVYLNDGSGGFPATGAAVADSNPSDSTVALVVTDVDRDTDPDIIEGNNTQTKRLYLNDGSGSFGNAVENAFPAETDATYGMATGDFDGDGLRDLAAAHQNTDNRLYTLSGTETGNQVQQLFSVAQSTRVDDGGGVPVASVKLVGSDTVPAGASVKYFVSNDGGTNFALAENGTPVGFDDPSLGQLKWRAEIESPRLSGEQPSVSQIDITVNNAPIKLFDPFPRRTFREGEEKFIDLSQLVEDPDGDALTYAITGLPVGSGLSIDPVTGSFGGTATNADSAATLFDVTLIASDGGLSVSGPFEVFVRATNDAPVITGPNPDAPVITAEATPVEIFLENVLVDDPDTPPENLTLIVLSDPTGEVYTNVGNVITPVPTIPEGETEIVIQVQVIVNDGELDSDPFGLDVTVTEVLDLEAPVVTLNGEATIAVEQGQPFTDPGATAVDNVDGDLTDQIVVDGVVDTAVLGTYTLTYSATDAAGNTGSATRTVNVVEPGSDTVPPVVTLNGEATITIDQGEPFTDPGATAVDDVDGDLTDQIVVDGVVDTAVVGTYTLTYSATDAAGNVGSATRTVNVVDPGSDIVPPVVTLVGDATITIKQGEPFTDPGATAVDDVDGDLTDQIVVDGVVDTAVVGTYTLTYSATDAAGNTGSATRTVNVVADAPPTVTLIGPASVTVQLGAMYTDQGATAVDEEDGDLTDQLVSESNVNTSAIGTYEVVWRVTDSAGNVGQATRTVEVVADTPPVVTLNGTSPVSIRRGNAFNDPGATATDELDGDLTDQIVVTGNVDTSTVGTYTLTYSVTDSGGNVGEATRTVNVTSGGGGGGGGATGLWLLAGLAGAVGLRRRRYR